MNPERQLFITFYLGKHPYALPAEAIVEISPLAVLEAIPKAPAYIAGLFHYRGQIVPVADLCQLLYDQPCSIRMSTRIVLVHYPSAQTPQHVLGLLAERVTDTVYINQDDLQDDGVEIDDAPYLGPVYYDLSGQIRCIEIDRILPDALKERLFQTALEEVHAEQ